MAGWTYTTLVQAIKDFTQNDETTFNDNIDTFIQNAEERILYSVDLEVFRRNQTGTLTQNNKYLAVPSDYLAPFSLNVTANGTQNFLLNKDVEYLQEYNPTNSTGVPKYYAIFDISNFILAPVPDSNYSVELHYYHRPDSIVTAGTTWLGTYAMEAMLYGALIEAYTFMKGDQELMAVYVMRFKESLDRLKNYGEGRENIDVYRDGLIRTKAN
jgi:hypothetical protein